MNSKTIIRSIVFFVLVFFLLEVAISQSIISFKDKYGRTLQAEIYEKTGSAKRIFGLNLHISQYGYKRRNLSSSGWLLVLVYGEGGPLSIKELILKEEINPEIPIGFSLFQNYPNPFNSNTVIYFTLPEAGMVSLSVFDSLGREVATLLNEQRPAGIHKVYFDAGTLPSGVYFYKLKSSGKMAIRKMLLVR
jgi:hypothetical protein